MKLSRRTWYTLKDLGQLLHDEEKAIQNDIEWKEYQSEIEECKRQYRNAKDSKQIKFWADVQWRVENQKSRLVQAMKTESKNRHQKIANSEARLWQYWRTI
jgi:seryl-tRNA synthetase